MKTEIKAPPLTKNYSLVGTAFDYLMRFYMGRHNKHKVVQTYDWIADTAFQELMHDFSRPGLMGTGGTRFFKTKSTSRSDKQQLIKSVSTSYGEAKASYLAYYFDGQLTDELISNALFLSKLDCYYRSSGKEKIDFFEPAI